MKKASEEQKQRFDVDEAVLRALYKGKYSALSDIKKLNDIRWGKKDIWPMLDKLLSSPNAGDWIEQPVWNKPSGTLNLVRDLSIRLRSDVKDKELKPFSSLFRPVVGRIKSPSAALYFGNMLINADRYFEYCTTVLSRTAAVYTNRYGHRVLGVIWVMPYDDEKEIVFQQYIPEHGLFPGGKTRTSSDEKPLLSKALKEEENGTDLVVKTEVDDFFRDRSHTKHASRLLDLPV